MKNSEVQKLSLKKVRKMRRELYDKVRTEAEEILLKQLNYRLILSMSREQLSAALDAVNGVQKPQRRAA